MSKPPSSIEDRFWPKVDKDGPIPIHVPELGPCWVWTASSLKSGYGCLGKGGRSNGIYLAHRVSWYIHFGEIGRGLQVCHHCDNPSCVRPTHLFLGTQLDNHNDAVKKGRKNQNGSLNHMSKFEESDILIIRDRVTSGESQASIAREYDVSDDAISRIILRKRWSHVR